MLLDQLTQINLGEIITAATLLSVGIVTTVTQLLKYVPTRFTSGKYALLVNVLLSLVAALIIKGVPDTSNWVAFIVQVGTDVLAAAIAYHALVKPTVDNPQGTVAK